MLHQTVADTAIRGPEASIRSAAEPCSGIQWHVFHCNPRCERLADLALRRLGMETYLPLQIEYWHARRSREIVVVFPRYTFARFDVNAVEWGRDAILGRGGCGDVGKFLMSPTTRMPANVGPLGTRLIEDMMAEAKDGVIHPPEPREMRRGDVGRVLGGPLAEFTGICSRTARDRVWLLLTMLGRQQEVPFARDAVEIAA